MSSPTVRAPLSIACVFEVPVGDIERYCGWKPHADDKLTLSITTPVNSWHVQVSRGAVQKLMDAIKDSCGVEIQFKESDRP